MEENLIATAQTELTKLAEEFCAKFPQCVDFDIYADELTLNVKIGVDRDIVGICLQLLQAPYDFSLLIDLCGVDYLHYGAVEWQTTQATCQGFSRGVTGKQLNEQEKVSTDGRNIRSRFAVVYHLLSIKNNQRIRLHCWLQNESPRLATVTSIWPNADWYEREAFDLFGIIFDGHPDLRRILTDYGFVGHPFRKDFPLSGEVEMRYDAVEQRVVYEPVSIEPRTLVPKVIRPNDCLK